MLQMRRLENQQWTSRLSADTAKVLRDLNARRAGSSVISDLDVDGALPAGSEVSLAVNTSASVGEADSLLLGDDLHVDDAGFPLKDSELEDAELKQLVEDGLKSMPVTLTESRRSQADELSVMAQQHFKPEARGFVDQHLNGHFAHLRDSYVHQVNLAPSPNTPSTLAPA